MRIDLTARRYSSGPPPGVGDLWLCSSPLRQNEEVSRDLTGEADAWNESGSLFQRRGDAYLNERSVIFNEEMVGGREMVTSDNR